MTTIAQSLPREAYTVPRPARRNPLAAWKDLFFGPGPIWWRFVRWGQRNEID